MVNKRRRLTGEEVGGGREDPGGVRRRGNCGPETKCTHPVSETAL